MVTASVGAPGVTHPSDATEQKKRPVSDEAVDNVASVHVDDQYSVELGSVVLRQLRTNLCDTVQPHVAITQVVMLASILAE